MSEPNDVSPDEDIAIETDSAELDALSAIDALPSEPVAAAESPAHAEPAAEAASAPEEPAAPVAEPAVEAAEPTVEAAEAEPAAEVAEPELEPEAEIVAESFDEAEPVVEEAEPAAEAPAAADPAAEESVAAAEPEAEAAPPAVEEQAAPAPTAGLEDELQRRGLAMGPALAETAASEADRALRALLLYETGELDETLRADEVGAARSYLAGFNAAQTFRVPLWGMLRIYGRRRSVSHLVKLLEALARGVQEPRAKAEALAWRAELLEDRMDDAVAARALFEQAVESDPGYRFAWLALERTARRTGDAELLRRTLRTLAELTTDEVRRALLWTEVAQALAADDTPESRDEAALLLRRAAELPASRWRTLNELERFATTHDRRDDLLYAVESRAALAGTRARGEPFAGGSGEFQLERLASEDEARGAAVELWLRAAHLRLSYGDTGSEYFRALDEVLALRPDAARERLAVLYLCTEAGAFDRASEHAAWLLEHGPSDAQSKAWFHLVRALGAMRAGERGAALEQLEQARALAPDSALVQGAQVQLRLAQGDAAGTVGWYDAAAALEPAGPRRAAALRAGALLGLALGLERPEVLRRLRQASDEDPADLLSRRTLLALGDDDVERVSATVEELLKRELDPDERATLLLTRLRLERAEPARAAAAAVTAEALARVLTQTQWPLRLALRLHAVAGSFAHAARIAEELAATAEGAERTDLTATASRLFLAAGDDTKARTLSLTLHREEPEDPYLATVAFRLSLARGEAAAALEVLLRRGEAVEAEAGARWLVLGAVLLAQANAQPEALKALERAVERAPSLPAVRAALLVATRWRSHTALRATVTEAALEESDTASRDESVALGVELVLARVFLEHDRNAARELLDRVVARDGGNSLSVVLLQALTLGATLGPDAPETVSAVHGVLGALPAQDPLRSAFELEVARALSGSTDTLDQAREVRELVDEELGHSAAPRLLALLDAVQREDRREIAPTLLRVATTTEAAGAGPLYASALANLRAHGRDADARALAVEHDGLAASAVALSELGGVLEHSSSRAAGMLARAELALPATRPGLLRRAALWCSLSGRDADALSLAEGLVRADAKDVTAWDLLRVAGRRRAQWKRVVDACLALALRVQDKDRLASLFEEAGLVQLEQLRDNTGAERSLRKALQHDPRRVPAYRRLREILEKRKDFSSLEALVTTRIASTEQNSEVAELLWEQARLRRALGRREEALLSAQQVVAINAEHVAALALVAEVHATSGRLAEAAEALVQLAGARETPPAQRRVARQGAIDIFEHRLALPVRAIEQLDAQFTEGDADDKALVRAYNLATKSEQWEAALRFTMRSFDRAREMPQCLSLLLRAAELQRDQLREPEAALVTARRAHELSPSSLEALKMVYGLADEDERPRRARRTIEALREGLRLENVTASRLTPLDTAAQLAGDVVLSRAVRRTARAFGSELEARPVGFPTARVSLREPALALRFRDSEDTGTTVALLEAVLPEMVELAGLSTSQFGVGRSERIRGAHPLRDLVALHAAAVGWSEFELYYGGNEDARVAVVPDSTPAIVLGKRFTATPDEPQRYRLSRALLLSARGLGALQTLVPLDAAQVVLAALVAAELKPTGGTAAYEARLRPVAKALSRRTRKSIALSGQQLAASPEPAAELARAVRAALSTVRRGALVLSGSVIAALADLERIEPTPATRRELALFAVSDALVALVKETGAEQG